MLCSQNINVMDKVTIQCGPLRKSYDIFSLPSQMYDFMEKEGFCLPRRKTIADVPNEILSLIFRHLDKNSLKNVISVCQRFFDQSGPLLWSSVLRYAGTTQAEENGFNSPKLLAQSLSKPTTNRPYEHFIRKLKIIVESSLSVELCCPIQQFFGSLPHLSNLTHFQLKFPYIKQESADFLERMELNISLAFVELMKLPRLKVLEVELLDLENVCQVLETENSYSLENSVIAEMALGYHLMPVSDGSFQRFIQSFKVLESLKLWDVGVLSLSLWAEIMSSETTTRLEVDDAQFKPVANPSVPFSSRLQSLLLYDVSIESQTLRVLLSPMSLLTRLEFQKCRISNIAEISPIAVVIPQLEDFYYCYSGFASRFQPELIRGFADLSSRLCKLSIESSLAGESILKEFMGIPTLEEVYFYNYEVSATSLAEFFQSNTALRHVKLCYYPLDPSYLVPLLQHCPNIETFTTSGSVDESIQNLDQMVKKHPNLRLPMFQFDRVHGLKRNFEEYLRLFPRLANHLKFNYW